ncbi:cysteine-rich tail protein 1 [Polypterus senegalus]|uniref:cysteine-rich tail protein 1 n=1 Tax=Polypterus senegalus TaxID=55291 RepID=UPI0019631C94|nr:cysteine-rich tail protein 1 [Polypterus senegalus]
MNLSCVSADMESSEVTNPYGHITLPRAQLKITNLDNSTVISNPMAREQEQLPPGGFMPQGGRVVMTSQMNGANQSSVTAPYGAAYGAAVQHGGKTRPKSESEGGTCCTCCSCCRKKCCCVVS